MGPTCQVHLVLFIENMRKVRLMDGGLAAVLNVVTRKTTSSQ